MRKKLSALALPLALLFLLSGCGSGFFYPDFLESTPSPSPSPTTPLIPLPEQKPNANAFGIPYYPVEAFHPLNDDYRHNDDAAKLCYEGLVEIDADFAPKYLLASAIHTEDNIQYSVRLNPTARFWDGSPLRPEDVQYSYDIARNGQGPYAERLAVVADVQVAEDSVVITMHAPVFNAAALMDIPIIKPAPQPSADQEEDSDEDEDEDEDRDEDGEPTPPRTPSVMGTGAYSIHITDEEAYLLQNEYWWQGTPPIFRIELVPAEGPGELALGFGQTDISLMPIDVYDALAPGIKGSCDKTRYPTANMQYIGFNMAAELMQPSEIRRAIALLTDRETITDTLYGDYAQAVGLPVPPRSALYDTDMAGRTAYNPAGAKTLLEDAGLSDRDEDGFLEFRKGGRWEPFAPVMIVSAGSDYQVEAAEMVVQALRETGVNAELRILGRKAFSDALAAGEYDFYYTEVRQSFDFSPRAYATEGGALNPGGITVPVLEEAVLALEATPAAQRGSALKDFWRLFNVHAPIVPVCYRKMQVYSQFGLLENLSPTHGNPYYGWKHVIINK